MRTRLTILRTAFLISTTSSIGTSTWKMYSSMFRELMRDSRLALTRFSYPAYEWMTYQSPGRARSSRRSSRSGSIWGVSSSPAPSADGSASTCSSVGVSTASGCSDTSDLLSSSLGALVSECPEHQPADEEVEDTDVGNDREHENDDDDDEGRPLV